MSNNPQFYVLNPLKEPLLKEYRNLNIFKQLLKIIKQQQIYKTKHPPAKAGGFELRTGSPDTRRLNDASYGGSILNSSFELGSK